MPAVSHVYVERGGAGDITHLKLSGIIDETFSGDQLTKELTGHVIIDMGRIERISSFGVRQWMAFTREKPPGVRTVSIINATPMLVDQLATVEGFAGVAKVLSFLAPYECPKCGDEVLRRVDLRTDANTLRDHKAPEHQCIKCGTTLQFADTPDEFFAYARHQTIDSIPPEVDHYLQSLNAGGTQGPPQHTKMVDGDITFVRFAGELRADLNVRRLAGGLQGRVALDFGAVSSVDPQVGPKLLALLEEASREARVWLWRASPPVLKELVGKTLPTAVEVATVWLRMPCSRCGESVPQRILASEYLTELKAGEALERPCVVCGSPGSVPLHAELKALLMQKAAADPPLAEFEAIETRALSRSLQLLIGTSTATGNTPTGGIATDSTVDAGGQKLHILKRIGQGGMAEVFLARHEGLKGFEKYVVLKKILPQFASEPEFVEMLFAEARSSARLTHPNIVQVHDVGMMAGSAYITMEHVRGADLRRLMVGLRKVGQKLPLEHAVCIVAEIASALHYAHGYVDPTGVPHPVVHRDVSPANILISMDGAVKLSDFGIAKAIGEHEQTQPGMIKGKIGYLPPEMIAGKPLDGRADLFSLGIVLFELLTGKVPFRRENEVAALRAVALDPAPNPTGLNAAIDRDLSAVVLKALEKSPERRHQTGADFRAELEAAAASSGLYSSPDRVASFFRNALGAELEEVLGPSLAGTPQRATPSTPSGKGSDEGSPPEITAKTPIPVVVGKSIPAAGPGKPPSGDRPAVNKPSGERAAVKPPSGERPAVKSSSGERPAAPKVVSGPHAPQPKRVPTGPLRPEPVTTKPDVPVVMPPTPSEVHPAFAETGSGDVPVRQGRKSKWTRTKAVMVGIVGGIGAGALVLIGATVALSTGSADEQVRISNLEPGEHVYVRGVRVDSATVALKHNAEVPIAIGKDGALLRYGTVNAAPDVDASQIPTLHIAPGGRAELSVESEPKGCAVTLTVSSSSSKGVTPMTAPVPAGTETRVQVSCPGHPATEQFVLAAPGQKVAIMAQLSAPNDRQP